jgi:galactokinase/mevalonate kinase-like predicted kinase
VCANMSAPNELVGGQTVGVIVASAPGRCGIVGNPSDMYGGSVLSCTVQERAECRLTETDAPLTLSNDGETAALHTRADLALRGDKLDIARATLTFFEIDPATARFALTLRTDIPMRAGLAGSTAMLAAIVGALYARQGATPTPYEVAETTRKVEARVMRVVCGLQDQHMAVFGGLNFMNYAGKEMLEQRDDEPLATIEPLAALVPDPPLLLAHTGIQHHSGTVHQSPRERWLAGEPLVRQSYARIADLAIQAKRRLLDRDWSRLGVLMNENHSLVAALGGSGTANEHLIETARAAGAWGAKLAGAGGGGTILVLTDHPERLGDALMAAGAERLLTPKPQPGLTIRRE